MGFGCMGMTAFYGQHMKEETLVCKPGSLRSGDQHNEEIIGRFLRELPSGVVTVATKYMPSLHNGQCDLEAVEAAVDKSRSRLGVNAIDLYYCHRMRSPLARVDALHKRSRRRGQGEARGFVRSLPEMATPCACCAPSGLHTARVEFVVAGH
mmetsp:Transcript_54179/g.126093  ORF Transcript_54179/g.126093 Transcript_54179/m.126093 type:complete len:152 (+) Transcript_54179:32-487(+)